MKHRRFLALTLTLALTLSLAVPVWAAEDRSEETIYLYLDEYIEKYMEEHPEHYEAFDADAWFAESYDWCTKEEYMDFMSLEDEEAFKQMCWKEFLSYDFYEDNNDLYWEIAEAHDAYLLEIYEARHPGELDGLTTEDLLAQEGYTRTLTPAQQYMEDQELGSEGEVRPSLVEAYVWQRLLAERDHETFLEYQETYPEKWAEFDADAYFVERVFGDYDYPGSEEYASQYKESYMEWENLTTEEEFVEDMFRTYVESDRWQWDNEDDSNWSWPIYDRPISLVINGETYEGEDFFVEDGTSYLDAATVNELMGTHYEEGPVPVRTAAAEAGWDVIWSEYNREAILVDREIVMEQLEEKFGDWDRLLTELMKASAIPEGKTLRYAGEGTVTYTQFNSLDGDQTAVATIRHEQMAKDGLVNAGMTLQAGEFLALLPESSRRALEIRLPKNVMADLENILNNCELNVIENLEQGTLWINIPLLALLDNSFAEDTWLATDMDISELPAMEGSLSEMMYDRFLNSLAYGEFGAGPAWNDLADDLEMIPSIGEFTRQNGTITWNLNTKEANSLAAQLIGTEMSIFRICEITVTAGNGMSRMDLDLRLDMDGITQGLMNGIVGGNSSILELAYSLRNSIPDFRLTGHMENSSAGQTGSLEFHMKNQFELTLNMTATVQETDTQPLSQPPQGSPVMDLDESF